MAHLHQIVDLGAGADAGFTHRWAIDGAAAAHFHQIFQHHLAGLGHLAPAAGRGHKTKALRSHHGIGIHDAALAQAAAWVQHGIGVDGATCAQLHIGVEHSPGMQGAAGADHHIGSDHDPRANVHTSSDLSAGIHHGGGMDSGCWFGFWVELLEGLSKSKPRVFEGHPGDAKVGGLLLQFGIARQ